MSEDALLLTKRLAEAYNRKDWSAFADLLDTDAVYEAPDANNDGIERHEGVESILKFMKDWSTVIPDDTATFKESQLIDDDTVHCKVVWSGTRSGVPFELRGVTVPANGSTFTNRGSTTYKIRNGKIVRISDQFDVSEFLAGLGI